jgi:hypothetical protein
LKNNHNATTNNNNNDSTQHDQTFLECMKERLTRCLQLLKINEDSQISKTAFVLLEKTSKKSEKPQHGSWISSLDAIAGSCFLNQCVFSQSEVYDFLTVAVITSLENRTKAIDELIFRIYKDIMVTYESLNNKTRIAYPKIIVDIIAILAQGVDTSGKKIPIHNVEVYYQTRKSDAFVTSSEIPVTTATAASIESIERDVKIERPPVHIDVDSKLIDILSAITNRDEKDIQESVAKLERRDFLRLKDLCKNYSKIQKYSKLITHKDSPQKFKTELEKDTGRKLSSHQIQHATNSIRKTKLYIENVLDGKFIPHGAYGINHTKHNLEYGYLIVGLMQSSRKRVATKVEKT